MARPSPQTERLVALVDAIAARPEDGLTLSEIARHLAVTPATCHPMLVSLSELGWLVRHPVRRTYRLGPALVTVGRAAARGLSVVDLALPGMQRLRDDLGLTCIALAPGETHVTVAEVVRGPSGHGPHVRVGDQIPIAPPLGVGYVSWADEQTLRRWLDGVTSDPAKRARHEEAVRRSRARGYAVEQVTRVETELGRTLAQLDEHLGDHFGDQFGDFTRHSVQGDGHGRAQGSAQGNPQYGTAQADPYPDPGRAPAAVRLRTLLEEIAGELGDTDHDVVLDVDPDREYRLGRIGAGVVDADGDVALVLALHGFAPRTPGDRVADVGRRLAAVAAEVSARLRT
ncbi:IclR family transcriptional regulator [Yinghuangia seranimata]|uniref:IclR family transcriptional regulator n=1 Tax=Yinghuangia seranimata TaxID=408067 RepID=UPI00248ADEE2|nr:helix-turn-helix domain-containing protein [Yinghuangia seranimata]MDI2132536.1 helix-turn-helix domain-containing protein [Yinghuangia seranimata]